MRLLPKAPPLLLELLESRLLLSTYYVATTGSDGAAGSSSAPWGTLQKAADSVRAGDTVIVRAGTYNAGMNFAGKAGGTSTAPISFLADPGAIITHCATSGINADAAGINIENTAGGSGGWYIIKGFSINSDGSMQKAGIRVATSFNVQILNNTIQNAYTGIFVSTCDGALVQGNTCFNATAQHGIYMSNTHNYTVRGNTLYNNPWDGLHLNMSADIPGSINSNGLIEGNRIYNNTLSGIDMEGTVNCTFHNNLIYGNSKHGITLHNLDQPNTPACTGNTFTNNTILNNSYFAVQMMDGGNANNTFFNNILLGTSSTGLYGALGVKGGTAGLVSDYNVVNDDFSTDPGNSHITLAQWRTQTGQDQHSVNSSSANLFVNAAGNDYHLKAGAPAIDFGLASLNGHSSPVSDFDGISRPQGSGWDAGAFERQVSGSAIAGRFLFYKGSSRYDATSDALAIASDKTALLPGGTASFANYSSYSRGINGIMVDIAGTVSSLSAADFLFKVGNNSTPSGWTGAPTLLTFSVLPGGGVNGSTRVTIVWADNTIQNQWLQITVLANTHTNLVAPDVFYFGNAIGESGDNTGASPNAQVTSADESATRSHPASLVDGIALTNRYDFNRDGKVDAIDQLVVRNHLTTPTTALQLITVPGSGAGSAAVMALSATTDSVASPLEAAAKKTTRAKGWRVPWSYFMHRLN